MKKLLLTLLLAVIGLAASASDTTGKALSMRTSVKSYLSSEGYLPKIDNDGDIAFKYQGSNYYITFQNWRNQVYVEIFSLLDIEGANMGQVRRAANEAQKSLKFVRCDVLTSSISINIAIPAQTSSDFTSHFSTFLDIIKTCKERCKENYNGD